MRLLGTVAAATIAVSIFGCGKTDDPRQLSSAASYQELFYSSCVDLAGIFTKLAEGSAAAQVAGAAVDCPEGGTATYDPDLGLALFNDCAGVGAIINGSIYGMIETQQATITSGELVMTGDYTGTALINSGVMSWELPVADATTYWELRLNLDGAEVCIWSGAELLGPCPDQF